MRGDKFTNALIKKIQPKSEAFKIKAVGTGATKGLGLKVNSGGTVTWVFRFTLQGKKNTMQLGHYPQMEREEADAAARACRSVTEAGGDPRTLRESLTEAVTQEPEVFTVRHAIDEWLSRVDRADRQTIEERMARHIYPHVDGLPADAIDTPRWFGILGDCRDGTHTGLPAPSVADHLLRYLKAAFKQARILKRMASKELEDLNAGILGVKSASRSRILTRAELADVLRWTTGKNGARYYRSMIRVIALFACRTAEVRLSLVEEWDLDTGVWTVPAAHSKNGIPIARPIPDAACPFVSELLRAAGKAKSPLLLIEERTQAAVSQRISRLWQHFSHESAWSAHDIRRTVRTQLADLDVAPWVAESLLGHQISGIEGIYNRSQMLSEKAKALAIWHAEINKIERTGLLAVAPATAN